MTNTDKSKKADHAPAEMSAYDDGSITGHIKAPLKQRIKQLEVQCDELLVQLQATQAQLTFANQRESKLLAACKEVANTAEANGKATSATWVAEKLRAAIAKAEGSAQ